MKNESDELYLRPLLRRLYLRSMLVVGLVLLTAAASSLLARMHLQGQFADHLSQTVRNDLLMGNNAAALRVLNQNLGNFSKIQYTDHGLTLFELHGDDVPLWPHQTRIPVCLDSTVKCTSALIYDYSLLHYMPPLLFAALLVLTLLSLFFWIFRQHVITYYRAALKSQNEAALGRLSARICHDLKLPTLIFQKVAYLDDPKQFAAMRPQLQSHLQRLYAMIEKLKHAEIEGLLRMETHTLAERNLHAFLSSIAPTPESLQLSMRPELRVYLDQEKFERSLANLVLNAFQAGARQVQVKLQARQHDLVVTVENDGPAMAPEVVQSFLGDASRLSGSLGLRMVKDVVEAHGGLCALESHTRLTRFTLTFPNTVILSESIPRMPAPAPKPLTDMPPLVWLDADLLPIARRHITPEDQQPFELSADPPRLSTARLIVSRCETVIDHGIERSIPIILAAALPEDQAWLDALKSRLRMLRRAHAEIPHGI